MPNVEFHAGVKHTTPIPMCCTISNPVAAPPNALQIVHPMKALPLPCAFTAFAAKALPLPCASAAFAAEDTALVLGAPLPSWLRHYPCLALPLPSRLKTLPLPCGAALNPRASQWYHDNDRIKKTMPHELFQG